MSIQQQHHVGVTIPCYGQDGFPSTTEFEDEVEDYLRRLNPKKRAKALMSREMYGMILSVLLEPLSTAQYTAQFRFWAKRMFRVVTTPHATFIVHENRSVTIKDQIYDILVRCHGDINHAGRDRTHKQVRRYYSWLPKELVARFVKLCPICIRKRRREEQEPNSLKSSRRVRRRNGRVSRRTSPIKYVDGEGRDYNAQPQSHLDSIALGGGGGGNYADSLQASIRSNSEESNIYLQQGLEDNQDLGSSSSSSSSLLKFGTELLDYANYFLFFQAIQDGNVDYLSLPVPPPLPPPQHSQAPIDFETSEQTFLFDQDESGQLVPQIVYSGLPLLVGSTTYDGASDRMDESLTEIINYSNSKLPSPRVNDNSLSIFEFADPQQHVRELQSADQ
ncbi:integrase zinc binding domain-containing protein [Sporobolomyces salmoneus]|uniref:integrase zinc binding domain-containing protein n=1 Tax=Sporobolomyces salmoneus TaxID=183962 RepID=UPI00317147D9